MLREFYAESGLMFWPMLGMAILVITFLLVMGWTIFGLRKSPSLGRMAWLPLEDERSTDGTEETQIHE